MPVRKLESLFGPSTSSARHRRCCWPRRLVPTSRCGATASGRVVAVFFAATPEKAITDAKDAYVIAETASPARWDLSVIDTHTNLVRNLAVLNDLRADLIADRVPIIMPAARLDDHHPSLERAFDYSSHKGALGRLTATPPPIG